MNLVLYSFGYEFRSGSYQVNFYDSNPNIIAAESLGQIDHQSRRKWAQKLFEIFEKDSNVLQLECHPDESDSNLFSKRLVTEKWTPYVATFEMIQTQMTLHIYRFTFLFVLLLTDAFKSCVKLTPSACEMDTSVYLHFIYWGYGLRSLFYYRNKTNSRAEINPNLD